MSLTAHRKAVDLCTYCPKLCRWACPVAEAETRETVTPWALMTRVDDVMRGAAPMDAATAEIWSHCTGCGRCQTACKHKNDVKTVLYAARAEAGDLLPPALKIWADEVPPETAIDALPVAGSVRVLGGYAGPAVVEAALALLKAAGISVGRLHARTSGYRYREAGDPAGADSALKALKAELEGVEQIICLEAEDVAPMRARAPAVPGRPEAGRHQHLIEAIFPILLPLLRPTLAGDVLYLDACRLGRGLGLYDEPRALLAAAITGTVHEATMNRHEAGCCGAGAGYVAVDPIHAATVARESAADIADIPVVIAGGACAAHLRAALAPRPVYHLYEILASALPEKPQ